MSYATIEISIGPIGTSNCLIGTHIGLAEMLIRSSGHSICAVEMSIGPKEMLMELATSA